MFEWTDEYYSLLSEFNNALVDAQCKMRERLFRLSESVKETGLENLEFQGSVRTACTSVCRINSSWQT